MDKALPTISIIIPTYNEEKNIEQCLLAIFSQTYPKDLLEVIIIDNYSEDRTVEIVKKYDVKVFFSEIRDAEVSKMVGLHKAKGDQFLYLDADIEIVGKNWLNKLIRPLVSDLSLIASFPRFIPKPTDVGIGRYLRNHPLELDPVFQFFCTEIEDTIIEEERDYKVCEFDPRRTPPIGICIYRRKILMKTIGDMKKFMDIDVPILLSKKGYSRFAYVPKCGIYHVNIRSLRELIQKRIRNIDKIYLPNIQTREFKYFHLGNKKDIFRITFWIIYANLFVPNLIKGIYKTFKNKDICCMYEPVVATLLTNIIIWGFLRSKKGRGEILKKFKNHISKAV